MLHHRTNKPAVTRRLVLCTLVLGAFGCSEPELARVKPPAPPTSTDAIPSGTLGGKLAGEPFLTQSARYFIDRRPGFENVQISLSSGKANAPCEEALPETSASVWLRRPGGEALRPETVRLAEDSAAAWEVHYQVHREHGWRGNGTATALFSIKEVAPDLKLKAELWACFSDSSGSCVSGGFVADYCATRIDAPVRGTEAMERLPTGHTTPSKGGTE